MRLFKRLSSFGSLVAAMAAAGLMTAGPASASVLSLTLLYNDAPSGES